jgi:hypothetical protein
LAIAAASSASPLERQDWCQEHDRPYLTFGEQRCSNRLDVTCGCGPDQHQNGDSRRVQQRRQDERRDAQSSARQPWRTRQVVEMKHDKRGRKGNAGRQRRLEWGRGGGVHEAARNSAEASKNSSTGTPQVALF